MPGYTIKDYRVSVLPLVPVPNSRYYVPNGNGTDLDEYLTDLTGAYRFVGSAPVVITNGWELTGNTIIGSEYLGTNNNFPLNFYTNGLNTLELSNVPAQLYLKSGANPLFSMKQDITNHEFQIRLGDGNGILNSNWNVYEPIVDKIRFGLSSHTFIIGDILSPYSSSSLYVSSTSSAGANIDAQPNGINSDEANIEAMKSDYSNGEGVAMRVWGATGVVDTMMGYNKQNLGALEFNNITNLINVKTNAALRIGTNNTERITILGNGNIGLNEISPTEILHVNGTPRFVTGNEGLSKVWTSDANGVGDWVTPASPSTPTLQQVTDVGNTTTNDIVVADNRVIIFNDAGFGNIELTDAATVLASYNTSGIQYRVGSFYQSFESAASTINNISNTLPDISGILVLSVNGNTADSSGEITLPVGLGTVTSVDMNVPTGFAISGNPITTTGTLALAFDTGYSLPSNATQATWTAKQDALVSGTNIKTINSTSLLGSGDISISGCSFGTDNQIPYTNSGGTDFDYSANFTFDGTNLDVIGGATFSDEVRINRTDLGNYKLQVGGNIAGEEFNLFTSAGSSIGRLTNNSGYMALVSSSLIGIYPSGSLWLAGSYIQLGSKTYAGTPLGTSPTAWFHIRAGSATANTAPLKLTSGTNLTTEENGAMEYDGTHLYFTIGSTRYQLDQQSSGMTFSQAYAISTLNL